MNTKSTCIFCGDTFEGRVPIEHEMMYCPVAANIDKIVEKLKEIEGKIEDKKGLLPNLIYRMETYEPTRDKELLKPAKIIIAEEQVSENIKSVNMQIKRLYVPFQCFDSKRLLLPKEYAKDLEKKGIGWIVE